MAKDADRVFNEILTLPEAEQWDIAKRLIRILNAEAPAEEEAEILEAWLDEAERILASVNAGTEKTISWEEMKREFGRL